MITKEEVLSCLAQIKFKDGNLVSSDRVSAVIIKDKQVGFALDVDGLGDGIVKDLYDKCKFAVLQLKDVRDVKIILNVHNLGVEKKDLQDFMPKKNKNNKEKMRIAGVKKICLISAGKGGVGKSTVAVNMAVEMAKSGKKVGLVDADVYGPSIHKMMGISEKPKIMDGKMIPWEKYGVKFISIGQMVDDDSAIIWRGPMASKGLYQLLLGVHWGEIDVLYIDMPPGTSDIHISLAENFIIDEAILVSMPQNVSIIDVRRAYAMLRRMGIKVSGIIENMSYYKDANGKEIKIFGDKAHVEILSKELEIDFLGKIPIDTEIAASGDSGEPISLKRKILELS